MGGRDEPEITFPGGATAIGASSVLVQVAGMRLLVDCGVSFRTGALAGLSLLDGGSTRSCSSTRTPITAALCRSSAKPFLTHRSMPRPRPSSAT